MASRRRGVRPARAAARAARRRARRLVLRAAGAEGAGRRRAARRAGGAGRAGRRAARRPRGRLAARPGARAAHLCRDARRRGDLVLRRGRALLRRAPEPGGRPTSTRPRTSGWTSSCRATVRCPSATRPGAASCTVPAELVVPALQDAAAELRSATAALVDLPAGEEARGRGGARRAVVGVQLLPGRAPQPRRRQPRRADDLPRGRPARRARGLPRPPHRARGQGAAADPRPRD